MDDLLLVPGLAVLLCTLPAPGGDKIELLFGEWEEAGRDDCEFLESSISCWLADVGLVAVGGAVVFVLLDGTLAPPAILDSKCSFGVDLVLFTDATV